jgi:hypothetical protein
MLSNEIATYLAAQGIGTLGTDLFYNHMPSADNCLVVFDSGGLEAELKLSIDYPTIQLRARNTTASGAYNTLANAYNVLQGLHNVTLTTMHIIDCKMTSGPLNLGQDDKLRNEYTQNYSVTVVNKTAHRE